MRGHEAETYKRILGSHGGRHNGVHEDSFIEKVACYGECLEIVADEKRDDGSGGVSYLAAMLRKPSRAKLVSFQRFSWRSGSAIIMSMALRAAAVEAGVIDAVKI